MVCQQAQWCGKRCLIMTIGRGFDHRYGRAADPRHDVSSMSTLEMIHQLPHASPSIGNMPSCASAHFSTVTRPLPRVLQPYPCGGCCSPHWGRACELRARKGAGRRAPAARMAVRGPAGCAGHVDGGLGRRALTRPAAPSSIRPTDAGSRQGQSLCGVIQMRNSRLAHPAGAHPAIIHRVASPPLPPPHAAHICHAYKGGA